MSYEKEKTNDPRRNPDPITHTPGAHPVGSGVGAAVGGAAGIGGAVAAGAIAGAVAGPVGIIAGAAIGGVAGGLIGKGVAEEVNPTLEDKYWRDNYSSRPYVPAGTHYDEYAPAYKYGWESRSRFGAQEFDNAEPDMARNWDTAKGKSRLSWEHARPAAKDAWNRVPPNH